MCELYALCAAAPRDVTADLREFFTHSQRHPHGWGLAEWEGKPVTPNLAVRLEGLGPVDRYGEGNEAVTALKGPERALDAPQLAARLVEAVCAPQVFGHIRFGTRGGRSRANSQPFLSSAGGATWVIMHNGTLFEEGPVAEYAAAQEGESDSERLALYLGDALASATDTEARCAALERAIAAVAPHNKVNLILSDGTATYAHTNTDSATLYMCESPGCVRLCTVPLDGEPWAELERGRVYAWIAGERVYTGASHGHVYDDSAGPTPEALCSVAD